MNDITDILSSREAIIAYSSMSIGGLSAIYDRLRHNAKKHNLWPITLTATYGGYVTGSESRNFPDTMLGIMLSAGFFEAGYHGMYKLINSMKRTDLRDNSINKI